MKTVDRSRLIDTATGAARAAGKIIIGNLGGLSGDDINVKEASDFVTRVDRESERIIIDIIKEKYPDHFILSEESIKDAETEGYRWIIDPLDGTTNFIHQYPVFSVSIAVQMGGKTVAGVVFDPLRDELFSSAKEEGAYLNGRRINVSSIVSMDMALMTTGFPFRNKHVLDLYLKAFRRIFLIASGIRRAGSAAIDLAYLAAGRCEGFFELGLQAWDIAAGALLIKEAGGIVTDFGGGVGYLSTGNVVAACNKALHTVMLGEIKEVFGGTLSS